MRSTADTKRGSYYNCVVNWLTVVKAQFNINRTSPEHISLRDSAAETGVARETVTWFVSFMWDSPQCCAVHQFT